MSVSLSRTIEFNSELIHYQIEPTDQQDLPSALNRATPNGNYHASAHWNISWQYTYQTNNGQCQIESATVKLTTDMLMPQLDESFSVDLHTRETFELYYKNLITHEYGHLDFGVLAANDIETLLLDGTVMDSCDELGETSNTRAHGVISQYGLLDDQYDEETNHGRTQGAYIFDLL